MSLSALMSAPWCLYKRFFMWPVNGVKRRRLKRGGKIKEWQREGRRERGENLKMGSTRGWKKKKKKNKQEIPQSWYHMPGRPFLMRQRSMYSLALSHTGQTPIMPKLTCSNKTPPPPSPPPTPQPHPRCPARLCSAAYHPALSICIPCLRALPHFTGIPHWRSQTAVTRQRKGTWRSPSFSFALPSVPRTLC